MRRPSAALGALAAACCGIWQSDTVRADDGTAWSGAGDKELSAAGASAEHVTYSYANVLHVVPVYLERQVPETIEICEQAAPDGRPRPTLADHAAPGRQVGGLVDGRNGEDDDRDGAPVSAIGAVALPSDRLATGDAEGTGRCRLAEVLVPERQLVAYDVEYRYRDEVFVSRLSHDPGDRLRVRVAVAPAEGAMVADDAVLADGGY